jgi:hypothetical protein
MVGWLRQMDRGVSPNDIINSISATLSTANAEDRDDLMHHRETFLVIARREREALQFLDQMIEECPDDVRLRIRKANINLYFLKDLGEALKCIDAALDLASQTLLFRREALGVKARILLELGQGEELCNVLEAIMSMKMIKGIADVGRERDFIDQAPAGLILEDVVARYDAFCPKRVSGANSNEPPEYEPPEWE